MKYKGTLVVVSDCQKALRFYRDLFGLELIRDNDGNMELEDGLYLQGARYWKQFLGREAVPENNHTELYFEEPELEAFVGKLTALYPDTEFVNLPMTHSWGQRAVRFYDPDGNLIEVATPIEDAGPFSANIQEKQETMETSRLILRKWTPDDAESLFEYAKNPNVGPIAGWPPHQSIEGSRYVIDHVFNTPECYAVCEKENNIAIGAIELKLVGSTDMTERDDECELGYWLGEPFWGRGYIPEAAEALLKRAFEELGMTTVWCGYYDGNTKSKRVQEKLGFVYHHTCEDLEVPLLGEVRIGHTNVLTKEHWEQIHLQ